MRHNYAKEKLSAAVHSMASDPGDIGTRLWHAFQIFHTLSEKDFGEEYKDDWNFIYNSLTVEEPSYDEKGNLTMGRVENTLKAISESQSIRIIERIVSLASRLRNEAS